jgi:error-prone DNA polymerase
MAGSGEGETLALWREARAWWAGESYVQLRTFLDRNGIRRTAERTAPTLGVLGGSAPAPLSEDHSEEWSLRERKVRDEKVARATGALPRAYYERLVEERKEAGPLARQRVNDMRPDGRPQPVLAATAWSVAVRDGAEHPSAAEDLDRWGHPKARARARPNAYAPLHCLSGYAFGRSSMLAEEVGAYVAQCGCPAAAIADPHSLVGCVEFARACRRNDVKPLIGASVELPEGGEIVLVATTKRGYVNLSRLVTACHLEEPRQFPLGSWERLERYAEGLVCLTGGDVGPLDRLLVRRDREGAVALLERLVRVFGRESVYLEIERSFLPWQISVERQILELAERMRLTPVAGGALTHARRSQYPAQDVLLCAESLCVVDEVVGRKARRHPSQPQVHRPPERSLNAERFIRTCGEMAVLYADRPELLVNTLLLADRCEEDVLPERTKLPQLFPDDGHALREIVEAQAHLAYGEGLTPRHRRRLAHEVDRIVRLGFASHFLMAWDMCRYAREQGIGMSGRGSVIDSAVAYVLGFSRIDAIRHNLHFDRFLPEDGKRPDIDIDFEARRRDDVRGYLVRRYGVNRVGAVAAIGSYRTRGIVREVGKVFGLPPETIGFLAKRIHGGVSADQLEAALQGRPELRESRVPKERFRWVFELAERLMDVPTGIRTHSSGVVVTEGPLCDVVPVMWSASPTSGESGVEESQLRMIQWDKRTAKHYFDKFDVLCLRGQDVLGGVETRAKAADPDFSSDRLDAATDPEVYRAMRSGELVGIPQSASPAMRQAHMRLGTNDLHDASLVQAGIRPGVGGAVKINELIARRRGKPFSFEHPDLEAILGHTYGIIVFQEQVDQLLQTFCGYSSGQAEDIRDAIHKRRREDFGRTIQEQIVERVVSRGYSPAVAERVFDYVSGFKGYGFAQGHALAFAEISLRCVWLMQNKPAEYFASLLSAQPAGYYGPATIANEARSRGVTVLPLDVCRSKRRFEVEAAADPLTGLVVPNAAVRVGLMQLSGLSERTMARVLEHQEYAVEREASVARQPLRSVPREGGRIAMAGREEERPPELLPFGSVFDFAVKVEPSRDELEALILAGAFDRLCPNRRALLWAVPQVAAYVKAHRPDGPHPSLPFEIPEPPVSLGITDFSAEERAVHERALLGMDVERHLMAFERARVAEKGALTTAEIRRLPFGTKAVAVGNPIRLRFPPTQSGKRVVFFDLEDETALLNVTCFDETYQRDGHAIVTKQYVTVRGVVQDRDGTPAFLASRVFPYRPMLLGGRPERLPLSSGDFLVG